MLKVTGVEPLTAYTLGFHVVSEKGNEFIFPIEESKLKGQLSQARGRTIPVDVEIFSYFKHGRNLNILLRGPEETLNDGSKQRMSQVIPLQNLMETLRDAGLTLRITPRNIDDSRMEKYKAKRFRSRSKSKGRRSKGRRRRRSR